MTSTTLLTPTHVWNEKIYSNGWKHPGLGTEDVTEKATGAKLGTIGIASAQDIAAAAASAREAQRAWAKLVGPQRGDVLREAARLVLAYADELTEQLIRETGSIRAKAQWEVHVTARELLEAAALGSQPQGILTQTMEAGFQSIARRIPLGVIGIITPWNSPFILGVRAIAPALAMGNAVLLKPDVQSPIIGGVAFARVLEEAGLPKGLFHVLPGAAQTGAALVREPLINMVSFTGSSRVGREVGSVAGGQLKRVSLELGGNNPFIVLDDADIEAAASAGAWGSFFHQGQICLTTGRHLVHEDVAEAYVEALVKKAKALVVGNPLDAKVQVGPIINERQAANAERIVSQTVAEGAKLLTGGSRHGLFFEPTVITGVTAGMTAFDEEIFGPVAAITTFRTDKEAIALANATEYGLSAAVVSPDLARAQRVADALHSGVIHINDQTVVHGIYGPIGGVGISGNGFGHGASSNADQFSEWQWITVRSQLPSYPF
ncbi:aldehyde dehydrogenase family protein [Paraburkholderia sp. FT54]|uniref:aldehyde dehydrogenase family protein n=1 Tax=Paraburkholderia sp. FT54 TaxID=3074437 RepID=UPI002877775F|nr:aldehyde dehydrogenase family protein [Paraburkholderia sp. FT54]WNC94801.1 aldehyde dehydrogenase family protein [Paraburkholderia sp. FT54]